MRSWINLVETTVSTLQDVVQYAKDIGVTLDVSETDYRIDLNHIERTTGEPGAGEKAILALFSYADMTNKFIILQVDNGDRRLEAYYADLGFDDFNDEPDDDFPDWGYGNILVRYPDR